MSDLILEKFRQYSCFDVGYVEGLVCPMEPEIRPVLPGVKMVGRAFTVNEINAICKNIFDEIGKDEVLVVRGRDPKRMGGCGLQVCELIRARGAVGVVIDGGAQDTPKLKKLGFPVFSRYVVPTHGGLKLVGETQAPIECGGVHVRPGDIVMGDDDGVVVIPQCNEKQVLRQVELMREARDYVDAMTRHGVRLWDIPGLQEMWAEKERGLDYHWKVYEKWNAEHIPPEMRKPKS
ncbi:MAG: RraA family protein [Chloroflexi bacterium]|nr:RraA family protein [Chloroflexota bacterium]